MDQPATSTLLSPELLARLEKMELVSRKVFRGRMKGERRSPRKGQSVEFADFRNYVPGDDLRFVDWNTYARLEKLFLKMFLEEEDLHFYALIDASGSMDFGQPTKLKFAIQLAAALGFIGLVRGDRVKIETVGQPVRALAPAFRGRRSLWRMLDHLEELEKGVRGEKGVRSNLCAAPGGPFRQIGAAEKGTGPICAQHPEGRSGKLDLSPFPSIVGHTALFPVNRQKCEMLVVVCPGFQNVGIGTELVRTCIDLADELGLPELKTDSRFQDRDIRKSNRARLTTLLEEKLSGNTTSHWVEMLNEKGIPSGAVVGLGAALDSEQARHRQVIADVQQPGIGNIKIFNMTAKFSKTPAQIKTPPPGLSEHTKEILADLGYTVEEIKELKEKSVI